MERIRKIIAFITLTLSCLAVFSQDDENPVLWSHEFEKISDTEYDLIIKGKIHEGWHVYSQFNAEDASLPSEFDYGKAGVDYELVGKTEESATIVEYSDIFEVEETFSSTRPSLPNASSY